MKFHSDPSEVIAIVTITDPENPNKMLQKIDSEKLTNLSRRSSNTKGYSVSRETPYQLTINVTLSADRTLEVDGVGGTSIPQDLSKFGLQLFIHPVYNCPLDSMTGYRSDAVIVELG